MYPSQLRLLMASLYLHYPCLLLVALSASHILPAIIHFFSLPHDNENRLQPTPGAQRHFGSSTFFRGHGVGSMTPHSGNFLEQGPSVIWEKLVSLRQRTLSRSPVHPLPIMRTLLLGFTMLTNAGNEYSHLLKMLGIPPIADLPSQDTLQTSLALVLAPQSLARGIAAQLRHYPRELVDLPDRASAHNVRHALWRAGQGADVQALQHPPSRPSLAPRFDGLSETSRRASRTLWRQAKPVPVIWHGGGRRNRDGTERAREPGSKVHQDRFSPELEEPTTMISVGQAKARGRSRTPNTPKLLLKSRP
ncbi:hypothetical protein F5148DRAFT_1372058 [Russula earlei]|uniref:Uncharacterized protein n=1 Tax=Russula earlei TaxID=71964 RepID=A0ACC0TR81_9AGAM|nr:hypothetical protein F5148DRAFT_1372058 [Russula earlei]